MKQVLQSVGQRDQRKARDIQRAKKLLLAGFVKWFDAT